MQKLACCITMFVKDPGKLSKHYVRLILDFVISENDIRQRAYVGSLRFNLPDKRA